MGENRRPLLPTHDKLTFLLSLVPFLIDHGPISVSATADHFGVSEEQVRQAVRLIAVSGIPGETSQYQHGDLFDIAWDDFEENGQIVLTHLVAIDEAPRFSGREAAALIAGLQYLSALPEHSDRTAMASLTAKLSRGASASPSQVAIEVSAPDASLGLIRKAVATGVQVEFDYLNSRAERERRRVDPLRIESSGTDWYLRGWCHLRQAVRTFRFDRIDDLRITSDPISHRAGDFSLPSTLFESSAEDLAVTIDVTASAAPLLADYIATDVEPAEVDGRLRLSIRVPHFHALKRLIVGMSSVATVVEPAEARRAVADWAAAGAARYPEEE
ncbi:MAG: helix-turn-helix transcriptional regulator [Microbacteriaceae bacterium]